MPRRQATPTGTRSRSYGSAIGYARELLAVEGAVVPWQITAEGHDPGHVLHRLRVLGEAAQVRGSTLHVRPDVAAAIESAIAGARRTP